MMRSVIVTALVWEATDVELIPSRATQGMARTAISRADGRISLPDGTVPLASDRSMCRWKLRFGSQPPKFEDDRLAGGEAL